MADWAGFGGTRDHVPQVLQSHRLFFRSGKVFF